MKKVLILMLCVLAVFAIVSCKEEVKQKTKSFTVTFDSKGGSDVAEASVKENTAVAKPENPSLADYLFDGWYADAEYTTEYDFAAPVTEAITLHAKWCPVVVYRMTATTSAKRFSFKYIGGEVEGAINPQIGDVLTFKYRSSHPVTHLYLRSAAGGTPEIAKKVAITSDSIKDYFSEPDEDGWITFTYTYAEASDGFRFELANYNSGDHVDGNGPFAIGDWLEIKELSFGGHYLTIEPEGDATTGTHGIWNDSNTDQTHPTLEKYGVYTLKAEAEGSRYQVKWDDVEYAGGTLTFKFKGITLNQYTVRQPSPDVKFATNQAYTGEVGEDGWYTFTCDIPEGSYAGIGVSLFTTIAQGDVLMIKDISLEGKPLTLAQANNWPGTALTIALVE